MKKLIPKKGDPATDKAIPKLRREDQKQFHRN